MMNYYYVKNDYFHIHAQGTVIEEVRWAIATIIEMTFCIAVFAFSGLFPSKDADYNNRVTAFFHKLTVPFIPDAESKDADVFKNAIKLMYGIAFGLTGLMFIIMGFPSRSLLSGQLALGAGFLCFCVALFLYFGKKNTVETACSKY